MNVLLIVVLALVVIETVRGMKRGFIKTVFSVCSFIVTLIVTLLFSPMITKSLQNNEKVVGYFAEKIEAVLPLEEIWEQGAAEGAEEQKSFLEQLPLPDSVVEALVENNVVDYYEALGVHSFGDYISNYIACTIISAVSFVGVFLIVWIVLKILCFSLDLISKLPLLNQINQLCGLAAGFVHGMLLVWLGCIVLTAISGTEFGSNLMKMVAESELLSYIYGHNMLQSVLPDLAKTLF